MHRKPAAKFLAALPRGWNHPIGIAALGSLSALLACAPLFAATAPVTAPGDPLLPPATPVLKEILVTAPPDADSNGGSSLSALQAGDLQIHDAQDLSGLSPNLVYESGGEHSFNGIAGIRGLMNSLYFTDPTLVFYIDDVPYALPYTNQLNADSIDKIDLLKGPQGSIFGQNAPGGVIAVTQFQPTDLWAATVRNEYGSYESFKTFEQVSGPITQTVDFLASLHYDQRDGYLKNVTLGTRPDGQQEIEGRVALSWKPTDDLSFAFDAEQGSDHDGVQRFTPLSGPRDQISSQLDGATDSQSGLQSFKTTYETDDFRLLLISSHRSYDLDPDTVDLAFGAAPEPSTIAIDENQYMEEVRIESKEDADLKWSGGTSYQRVVLVPQSSQILSPGVGGASSTHEIFDSYAMFGQIEFKPFNKFSVQLGNRVQFDARSGTRSLVNPDSSQFFDREERQYFNVAPNVEATYQLSAHHALFASTGLTFRPGGYAPFAAAETLQPYGSEKTWANSAGWRADGWEQRVSTSLTLFWNQTYNYQLERYTYPLVDVVNVPEVSSRGIEWELEIKPIPTVTLQTQVGYTLATFDSYHDAVTGQSYAGNRVPYVPEETLLLAATYRHPLGWMAHIDYRGFGSTYFDQTNNPLYRQDAYGLLAMKLGYETTHWSAYLYGENLADIQYDTLIDSGLGVQVPGDPRTLGIGMALKW